MELQNSTAPSTSLPALHVTSCEQTAEDGDGPRSLDNLSSRSDWITGMPLVGGVQQRCGSSLSNYSGRSTPLSHRSVRPASSLSSLHHQKVQSSQQHHDLRHAALHGRADIITRLLKAGVSVDQTLRQGWTALMFACSSAQPEAVKVLLDHGADPNFHKELFTPLMAVCASSVRDAPHSGRSSELGDAASGGQDGGRGVESRVYNLDSVKSIDEKLDVSPSEARLLRCMELVLSSGAAVNASERHRLTPLMFASKEGRAALVRRLIAAGALPNARDNKGWTALCWACYGGHAACAQALLAAAADAALSTAHHQTAADIARERQHLQLAEIVEAAALGTPISAPESAQYSPLSSGGPSVAAPQHCSDLDMVLAGLGLSHLSTAFAKHKIDLVSFLRLSAGELSELGIREVGVQHKLLTAIAEMHRKAWQPSSVAPLSSSPYISLSDATSMLHNVNKHVSFLEATLAFLRQQLESSPASHHLHHNTTNSTMHTLIVATHDAAASINRLHSTTLFLSAHLEKLSETSHHCPSDLVVCTGPDAPRVWTRTVVAGAAAAAGVIVAVWWLSPSVWGPARPHTVLLDCN